MQDFEALKTMLRDTLLKGGSDIYIIPGSPITTKVNEKFVPLTDGKQGTVECTNYIKQIYEMAGGRDISRLAEEGDDDFSFGLAQVGRFRCNAFKQRGTFAAVLRAVPFDLPNPANLGIPQVVMDLSSRRQGMVLVTGPAGSGKSTTLSCIIDRINSEANAHIITLEDPIEFIHPHKMSIVTQREIMNDTQNFAHALRSALRQAPDVILLGEMRDYETIQTALTAAETGHLLLSTLHTVGASKTIDRIVDSFPSSQQAQVRMQLSLVLKAVVSQQLIPSVLVTGPAGSGKSTTLSCIIDRINSEANAHIITLEDPIEFIHPHKMSIVTQREIMNDTQNFAHALRSALRQAPDVILLGEMRDYETIQTALTAAETGHLLLSTLHTVGASKTIDRIVDSFPSSQQAQVRMQLSLVLKAVVSQQLIPSTDGGLVAAFEVMIVDNAISNMIREGKVHQMDNVIYAGAAQGMFTMDTDIMRLYKAGKITKENALMYSINQELMAKKLG